MDNTFTHKTGKLFGQLALGSDINPFPSHTQEFRDWSEGYKAGLEAGQLVKGDMFEIEHVSGEKLSVCADTLEIGDPIVIACPMYGILARRSHLSDYELIKTSVKKINGSVNNEIVTDPFSDMITTEEKLGLVYLAAKTFRLIG